ncbi:hypothetical protein OE88DRAFT_1720985 [Heliocybe sulcata]|uniref:Uncharacterized protein n=1 Tax=Heliocybe sulcata TaxID=5364 RepID=A0A5C3MN14_9AGAM|nr:hypothetical protein OE88DRAFT_1720985 [Heliocybe sulcata]
MDTSRNGGISHAAPSPKTRIKSGSIQQSADLVIELIEREKAKAVEQIRREYLELDKRFTEFRLASNGTMRTALDRSQAWSRAIQQARHESDGCREVLTRLKCIVRESPATQAILKERNICSANELDLIVLLPEILNLYQKSQTDLLASQQKCAELRRERDSDIHRLNRKLLELQEQFDALRESTAFEDAVSELDSRKVPSSDRSASESCSNSPEIPLRQISRSTHTIRNLTHADSYMLRTQTRQPLELLIAQMCTIRVL